MRARQTGVYHCRTKSCASRLQDQMIGLRNTTFNHVAYQLFDERTRCQRNVIDESVSLLHLDALAVSYEDCSPSSTACSSRIMAFLGLPNASSHDFLALSGIYRVHNSSEETQPPQAGTGWDRLGPVQPRVPGDATADIIVETMVTHNVSSRLCSAGEDTFSGGVWVDDGVSVGSTADEAHRCPSTFSYMSSHHPESEYLCSERSFPVAHFLPRCQVQTVLEAAPALRSCLTRGEIHFVGDSINVQQHVATRCELEHAGLESLLSEYQHWSPLLRSDLPCSSRCSENAFFSANVEGRCKQCDISGKRRPHLPLLSEKWYANAQDARILVISAGIWYNSFQLGAGPDVHQLYAETLAEIAPLLQGLVDDSGMRVYWLDIPPRPDQTHGERSDYGWDYFGTRNEQAAQVLRASAPGVIFLNTTAATLPLRSLRGLGQSINGPHWCSPGPDSAPGLIARHLLHDIAHSALCRQASQ